MVGVIFATQREAAPFLHKIRATAWDPQPFVKYRTAHETHRPTITVISGMGKVAATMAAGHLVLADRVSMIVNVGLCGRLTMDKRWSVGDLFRIDSAIEGDCDRFGLAASAVACDRRWFGELKPARLVTNDRPVFDAAWRDRLSGIGDLADMEGAAVARVAMLYGIPCAMLKGISDWADETGRRDVASHVDWVSGRIADVLVRELTINPVDERS